MGARASYHDLWNAIPYKKKKKEKKREREKGQVQERGCLRNQKTKEKDMFQRTNPSYLQKVVWRCLYVQNFYLQELLRDEIRDHFAGSLSMVIGVPWRKNDNDLRMDGERTKGDVVVMHRDYQENVLFIFSST